MFNRVLIAALSAGLLASMPVGDAEAGHRFKNHWFYGNQDNQPPHYNRQFEKISPEEYERLYGDDFDETYYDPNYVPPVRKVTPDKKKAAKSEPMARKKATPLNASAQPTARKPELKSKTALSCDKASTIISGYGFSAIKASDCTSQVYSFDAARDGKSYAIKLNSASGELTEVRKVR
jgi:hypothetical protein